MMGDLWFEEMPMRWGIRVLMVACVVAGWRASAVAQEAVGTEAELRQMLKDGQYQPLVLKATRLLQLKGNAANGVNRAKVYMLKGEAQLHLKQGAQAIDSFANAAKEAKDPKDAALATATEALARKSAAGKYTVRSKTGGKPEVIDILDEEGRKKAFAALYEEESRLAAPKIKAGESARVLPAIVEALKVVMRLGAIEQAAFGTDEKTAATAKNLGAHAQKLLQEGLLGISGEVKQVSARANRQTRQKDAVSGGWVMVKEGLSPVDTRLLRADVNNCDKIAEAAKDFATVTKVSALGDVSSEAARVSAEAQKLLDTDWNPGRGNLNNRR
jgi:hypothetical protein